MFSSLTSSPRPVWNCSKLGALGWLTLRAPFLLSSGLLFGFPALLHRILTSDTDLGVNLVALNSRIVFLVYDAPLFWGPSHQVYTNSSSVTALLEVRVCLLLWTRRCDESRVQQRSGVGDAEVQTKGYKRISSVLSVVKETKGKILI